MRGVGATEARGVGQATGERAGEGQRRRGRYEGGGVGARESALLRRMRAPQLTPAPFDRANPITRTSLRGSRDLLCCVVSCHRGMLFP